MTDSTENVTSEEIPGQQTIEEALSVEGEPNSDPTVTDGESTEDAPPETADDTESASGESTSPESDPTGESIPVDSPVTDYPTGSSDTLDTSSGSDTPQQHRFRIVHEQSNLGDASPHRSTTSAPVPFHELGKMLTELAELLGI